MTSFTVKQPQHLLHKVIEPQWIPYREEETVSTLTILEAAEEAHSQRLSKIVQNESNVIVIGQRQTSSRRRNHNQRRTSEEVSTTDEHDETSTVVAQPVPHLPQGRFWNRRRSTTSTNGNGESLPAF